MSDGRVLIVGAGPTGLVLALMLARHGVPLRIVDKNAGPGRASRAMVAHARTLEFYRQLGFADEVVARGIKAEAVHLREEGEEVAKLALGDLGKGLSPYPFALRYPQDDHERFLVEKLKAAGIEVEWGVELKAFTRDEAGVRAVLDRGGAEEVFEAAYLCGCDGAHSLVRHGLGLDFPGGDYEQLFYVADVKIDGAFRTDVFINLGADSLALMLPVRSGGMQRLIGIVPRHLAGRDGLTFEDIRPGAESLLGVRVASVNWFSTYRVHHRVAAHFRSGRCFIAGDAGHIHSPAGGQGMNTGIGDAVNLGWELADVLRGRADPSLLDSYETERIAFARKLVATTDRAFSGMVGRGRGSRVLRTWLVPRLMPFLTGLSAVRRTIFRTVSQVRITYRGSALSAGQAGRVAGGDRLPWVADAGGDNFPPPGSMDWQAHVYGAVRPKFAAAAAELGLPLRAFAWGEAAKHAGLARDALYLVRPDGHVALASPEQDAGRLRAFAGGLGLRFGPTGGPVRRRA